MYEEMSINITIAIGQKMTKFITVVRKRCTHKKLIMLGVASASNYVRKKQQDLDLSGRHAVGGTDAL